MKIKVIPLEPNGKEFRAVVLNLTQSHRVYGTGTLITIDEEEMFPEGLTQGLDYSQDLDTLIKVHFLNESGLNVPIEDIKLELKHLYAEDKGSIKDEYRRRANEST